MAGATYYNLHIRCQLSHVPRKKNQQIDLSSSLSSISKCVHILGIKNGLGFNIKC